jgi:hypothetical protein
LICLPVSAQGVKDLNGRATIECLAILQLRVNKSENPWASQEL